MISRLSIEGMAIIDSLQIDFSTGFNVITGETGAGKSILIKALGLLLGGKASADSIRQGRETATVGGVFQLPRDHEAVFLLQNLGVVVEPEGQEVELIVRRQLTQKGKSSSWINDSPVTTQTLKELGGTLVDIFGQHDNQKLLKPENHLNYLNAFLPEKGILLQVGALFRELDQGVQEIKSAIEGRKAHDKDSDYRKFRLEELEKFQPESDDYLKVKELVETSESSLKVREGISEAIGYLESDTSNVNQSVWETAKILKRLSSLQEVPAFKTISELAVAAEGIASQVEELQFSLSRLVEEWGVDQETVEEAQKRLYGYQDLFRKHGVTSVEELVEEHQKLVHEMSDNETFGLKLLSRVTELAEVASKLEGKAKELSRLRMKVGNSVKKQVEKELSELAMPGAKFEVRWKNVERTLSGATLSEYGSRELEDRWRQALSQLASTQEGGQETAEFLLASNPGESLLPLTKVASGGELSRIMLALKKSLAVDAETCVLVFDEIDIGISGRVADVVGRKMQDLSSQFQVLCISHLPQVAVYADTHFLVAKKKSAKSGRMESQIFPLSKEESAREVARLLSGSEVSDAGLANAKALMKKAKSLKDTRPAR